MIYTNRCYRKQFFAMCVCIAFIMCFSFKASAYGGSETGDGEGSSNSIVFQDSFSWISAYETLPKDIKHMISHIPFDVYTEVQIETIEPMFFLSNSTFPLSGGEPVYNPSYWNSASNINRANCYAYAMDVICTSEGDLQPGVLSGQRYSTLSASSIIAAVKRDGPYLGNGRTIVNTSSGATSTSNSFKAALVLDTTGNIRDYHWYVQNSNSYWSHKQGTGGEATNLDASGNYITNPQTCDKNYGYYSAFGDELNYSLFGGYVMVTRN